MEQKQILSEIELSIEGDRHIIGFNGCYFQIGEVLFEIFRHRQQEYSWQEISDILNNRFKKNIPAYEIKEIFQGKLSGIVKGATKKKKSYIYFKLNFLSEGAIEKFTKLFVYLFKPNIFLMMGILSLCITVYYFLFDLNYDELIGSVNLQLAKLGTAVFFLYLVSISIMIFHELGHATASRYFGVRSSSIGFGFYIIFPVFFTDVSKIWKLNVKERIVVNLGGIYFQLLINLILISISKTTDLQTIKIASNLLIISNTFIVLASLNPFLRNDGYWIYCDYFKIYNLMEKVMIGPTSFFKKYYSKIKFNRETLPITVYGTINYFIFGLIGYMIIKNLYTSYFSITELTLKEGIFDRFSLQKFLQLIKILFSIIICSIYIVKVVKLFFQKISLNRSPDHT